MFGKIVAISTVKHLSRNYASFSNQVCKSGIAYPLLVRHKISQTDTADFHGDGYPCRTQDTKQKKSPLWCVMLTLKRNGCKSIFRFRSRFFHMDHDNELNWLYAIVQKQTKTSNNAQIYTFNTQVKFLLPL